MFARWISTAAIVTALGCLACGCNSRKTVFATAPVAPTTAAPVTSNDGPVGTPLPTPAPASTPAAPVTSTTTPTTTTQAATRTLAGDGLAGFSGDGGLAVDARLDVPGDVTLDPQGNLYVADTGNSRVRRIDAQTGAITTVAGDGTFGFAGDGGPATAAQLKAPTGISFDMNGNLYIADALDHRIRMVDTAGIITTLAGDGTPGFNGDNADATLAQLNTPIRVEVTPMADRIFIVDRGNHRIRKIQGGSMITVVGNNATPGGPGGFGGDGGVGQEALLDSPSGLAFDEQYNLYIADTGNNRIRRLDWQTFIITTVAGTGTAGFAGDGGAAGEAQLDAPADVFLDTQTMRLYISDAGNRRLRVLSDVSQGAAAVISTVAGNGEPAPLLPSSDPLPRFTAPSGLTLGADPTWLLVADQDDHRVRGAKLP